MTEREILLESVRDAFNEPIDGRLEDGGEEEWTARVNNVAQLLSDIKDMDQTLGRTDSFWQTVAGIVVDAAGISREVQP